MSDALRRADPNLDPAKTRTAYDELQQLNSKYGELATDAALAAGGALPPPAGTAADVASLGRSLWKGDWGGALLDVVGFVPIVGDAAKAGKIANKLNDLRRALDVAGAGMTRQFRRTKEVAAQYWDDVLATNRRAYDDALKNCTTPACRESAALLKGPQYHNTPKSGANGQWNGERGDGVWNPTNGGPSITYSKGFPDYSPHVYSRNGVSGDVEIPMQGTRSDFSTADRAMRDKLGDPNWRRPRNHTWHHKEDGVTMQLIPSNVHATGSGASTPHMGGSSMHGGGQAQEF